MGKALQTAGKISGEAEKSTTLNILSKSATYFYVETVKNMSDHTWQHKQQNSSICTAAKGTVCITSGCVHTKTIMCENSEKQ